MRMTGAELKQRLRGLADGECVVVEGVEFTSVNGDFHVEYPEGWGLLKRTDLPDEFDDAATYEVFGCD